MTPLPVELMRVVHQYLSFLRTRSCRNLFAKPALSLMPKGVPKSLLTLAVSTQDIATSFVKSGRAGSNTELQ